MKLTALLTFKNEEFYLKYTIEHLISQGFEIYLIDNESSDNSRSIAKRYLNKGVVTIDSIKTRGIFNLRKILKYEETIANTYNSDWFMHCDADEIRLPHWPYKKMSSAVLNADKKGFNAINFKEFIFMPEKGKDYTNKDYEKLMKYYYCYEPAPLHRLNLWKRQNGDVKLSHGGGHQVLFEGIKLYPKDFILKHYIFLSEEHAKSKYTKRNFSKYEVRTLGWHGFRANFEAQNLLIPPKYELKYSINNKLDSSNPLKKHMFYKFEKDSEQKIIDVNVNNSPVHFLHINKTGGSAISQTLIPLTPKYTNLHFHGHEVNFKSIPKGEFIYFGIRDPITKYISGFYTRQRKGFPRNNSDWSLGEKIAFRWFKTPEHLAVSLYDKSIFEKMKARFAINMIYHTKKKYKDWLNSIDYLKSREDDLIFVLRQENLTQDFNKLLKMLNIKDNIKLPTDNIGMHKNPSHLSYKLSKKSEKNLKKWYKKDYEFLSMINKLSKEKGWWTVHDS